MAGEINKKASVEIYGERRLRNDVPVSNYDPAVRGTNSWCGVSDEVRPDGGLVDGGACPVASSRGRGGELLLHHLE